MPQAIGDRTAQERVTVHEVDRADGLELLDENARFYLRISGREFVERWSRGEYQKLDVDPNVMLVASLLPLIA